MVLKNKLSFRAAALWVLRSAAGRWWVRTGCGVCGVEQLNDIGKPVQPLPFTQTFDLNKLDDALRHLNDFQPVGQLTGRNDAAAWMLPSGELVGGHEDVGRHVALDKLLGRRSQEGKAAARCGTGFQSCQL